MVSIGAVPQDLDIASDIVEERIRQNEKWGRQHHPDGTGLKGYADIAGWARVNCDQAAKNGSLTWRYILDEEVAEAYAETDPAKLRAELIQVAAVAAAWVADIDDREAGRA